MAKFSKGLWVVVMDEDRALVLENTGSAMRPDLTLKERINSADILAVNDRSARSQDHKHHEETQPPDYHRMAGAVLARAVMDDLVRAHEAGQFSELALVAPPQVLGALRALLPTALAHLVVAELHKELTGLTLEKITEHLRHDLVAE